MIKMTIIPENVTNVASEFMKYADTIDEMVEKFLKSDYFEFEFETKLAALEFYAGKIIKNKPVDIVNELKFQSIQIRKWADLLDEIGNACAAPDVPLQHNFFVG